jgi:type IV secretory pathway TraG/TraD family ATPase VirD4
VRKAPASPDTPTGKANPGGVLFLPYRAGQIPALRSIVSAWMRLAIFEAMNREEGEQRLWFVVDELDALGQIDGLKDALARLRKFGGRCVLGFQSIAQVSSTYGSGEAQTIVENCGNTLILRCSGSEHGGTSQFASRLIGEREVTRVTSSRSRRPTEFFSSITQTEHTGVEAAVMGSEIEQLPDLSGYLKLASSPGWRRVRLRAPDAQLRAEPRQRTTGILTFPQASTPPPRAMAPVAQPPRTAGRDDFGME